MPLKLKEAEALLVSAAGLTVIWVSGAIVSLLIVSVSAPRLAAASLRQRRRVLAPSLRSAALTLEMWLAGWEP